MLISKNITKKIRILLFVACVVLKLLLTGYSADSQGASAQHATKFSFTQCLVNDKSAPRELPLRVRLLRSSIESFYQVMLIVWWHENIRNLGSIKFWKHYKNKLLILLAAQSKAWVCSCSLAGIAGSYPAGDGCLSSVGVVCCQIEVSATGRSLLQRSPMSVVCVCVFSTPRRWGGPSPRGLSSH
jgi:hypothetical protein